MNLVSTMLVGAGLLAALQFGTATADSVHAVTAGLSMLRITAPVALAAAIFWAIGPLISRGETSISD